jgi:ketosteroid isomerase-like protein
MRCLIPGLALLASLASAQVPAEPVDPRPEPSITLPPQLARVLTDYEAAWRAKDSAALAQLFAEDGFVLSNDSPMVRGRRAIARFYDGKGGPLFLRAVAYAVDGKVGYIIGAFTHRSGAPDDGKFTLTLKKVGRWLITSDMDNGNRYPQARASPSDL